jgi:hypothetical protein
LRLLTDQLHSSQEDNHTLAQKLTDEQANGNLARQENEKSQSYFEGEKSQIEAGLVEALAENGRDCASHERFKDLSKAREQMQKGSMEAMDRTLQAHMNKHEQVVKKASRMDVQNKDLQEQLDWSIEG